MWVDFKCFLALSIGHFLLVTWHVKYSILEGAIWGFGSFRSVSVGEIRDRGRGRERETERDREKVN